MTVFWKRYEKQLADAQRRAEKEAVERQKIEVPVPACAALSRAERLGRRSGGRSAASR
jgi:hypothetical protein